MFLHSFDSNFFLGIIAAQSNKTNNKTNKKNKINKNPKKKMK